MKVLITMADSWLSRLKAGALSSNQKSAARALKRGDLFDATRFARRERLDTNDRGRRVVQQLTDALINETGDQSATGNLAKAWTTITAASDVAMLSDRDRISREKNSLVELTIEAANELLTNGRTTSALRMVKELKQRAIRDWRAERIEETANLIQRSDEAAVRGNFELGAELLSKALELRPDLTCLESRIATFQVHASRLNKLTTQLKQALLESRRKDVEQICREMLVLAPNFQLAVDAHRQMAQVPKTRLQPGPSTSLLFSGGSDDNSSRARATWAEICAADSSPDHTDFQLSQNKNDDAKMDPNLQPFMIWVDAVGGFLVCPGKSNIIGQAIPDANVEIPMLGDLQRRHVRIESVDGAHFIHPLGNVEIDGKKIESAMTLVHEQIIEMEGGVHVQYLKPHPLSASAFLKFVSRHRTQPWSDGVLLASGPLMLGPDPRCQVLCPRWKGQLMLFHRAGSWFARTTGRLEIDSVSYDGEGPLKLTSRIQTEDFSLTLEPFPLNV